MRTHPAVKKTRTQLCFAPGCGQEISIKHLGCRRHWCSLPKDLTQRIVNAWRDGLKHKLHPTHEFNMAMHDAMDFIRNKRAATAARAANAEDSKVAA